MKLLLLLSVFTVGLYTYTAAPYDDDEVENKSLKKREIILESSMYGLLSFVPTRNRMARAIGDGMNSKLAHIEKRVKNLCGDSKKLTDSIESMKICMRTKQMFVTQRDEYIEHIDTCSEDSRNILRKCLPQKLQYFPDFFFNLVESVVKLMYDDFGEIARGLSPCMPKLTEQASKDDYEDCAEKVQQDYQDEMLEAKKTFCDQFIHISECFIKQINHTCTTNKDLEKFKKDYMTAMERPCS